MIWIVEHENSPFKIKYFIKLIIKIRKSNNKGMMIILRTLKSSTYVKVELEFIGYQPYALDAFIDTGSSTTVA